MIKSLAFLRCSSPLQFCCIRRVFFFFSPSTCCLSLTNSWRALVLFWLGGGFLQGNFHLPHSYFKTCRPLVPRIFFFFFIPSPGLSHLYWLFRFDGVSVAFSCSVVLYSSLRSQFFFFFFGKFLPLFFFYADGEFRECSCFSPAAVGAYFAFIGLNRVHPPPLT